MQVGEAAVSGMAREGLATSLPHDERPIALSFLSLLRAYPPLSGSPPTPIGICALFLARETARVRAASHRASVLQFGPDEADYTYLEDPAW